MNILYSIISPDGETVEVGVPWGSWKTFPDGSIVSKPPRNYVSPEGYTVVEYKPPTPEEMEPETEERRLSRSVDALAVFYAMEHFGILEDARAVAERLGGKTKVFWDRSLDWTFEGTHETAILSKVEFQGQPMNRQRQRQLFVRAQRDFVEQ